ncbi:MAG: hypothetical protein ABIO70_27005 [Pseudomonadota bacterium]
MRALFLLPLLIACARHEEAPATVAEPPAASGPFLYATATRTAEPTPARFAGPLPASLTALGGDWHDAPPRVLVRAQLCQGQAATWDKLGTAVDAAAADGDPVAEVAKGYGELLRYCDAPASCALARRWVQEQPAGTARAGVAWIRLAECPDAIDLFRTEVAPDTALAAFWFERAWGSAPEYVPALGAALGRIAAGDDSWLVRQAAVAHGKLDDGRVARDLLAAHAAAREDRVRGQVIAGMSEQSDPRVKAIFAAYCAQPDTRETLCPGKASVVIGAEPPREPADPEAPLRDPAVVHSALQDGDRQATVALLTGLRTLADRDWTAAHALAATLTPGPRTDPTLADTVAALARFGARAEVEAATRAIAPLREATEAASWLTPADLLAERGPCHWFDVETGMFPNEHDGLLAELAALAGPPLADVVFTELPPPLVEAGEPLGVAVDVIIDGSGRLLRPAAPGGAYRLLAWTGTERFEVPARDLGDWYDLAAVLGMLNTLARALGQDSRFVTLPTGDQTAIVLTAPGPAIEAAVAEGLIRLEDAGAGEADGKAFEEEVRRRIEAGEW